ncbi:2-keto-4-pentenoate hydratase [Kineosphaera limosa]|uniref:Putative 2-hydroxypenta-2,4-dienoate hydratase n=1 Tax=Kineosphaera limosa NBRC 100340 TaxID=1184609 RepID=K6WU39_9MICO|nr:fumarylacetoacetate hydrolase family protein [Kineosphaera limosa]NYE01780.1 2-keto-4-pentenoate hydratase [Kineosphaera limosa]GAB97331.1 putative 2-hydroxypenta-2,4-dienoate hydratase [Kineosphaera limosa NBRC 100340]
MSISTPRVEDLRRAATLLAQTRRDNSVLDHLPAQVAPSDIEESYLVADLLAQDLGWPIKGWFCGATNVAIQELLGLDGPYHARLFEHLVFESPATLDPDLFPPMVIETEVVFTLGESLPPREQPYTQEEVAAAVASVSGSIEVVAGHLYDWPNQDPFSVIADNGTDGALITGPAVTQWRELDLADITVEVRVNGQVAGSGQSDSVLGNPLVAMTWLANERSQRGDGLVAGHVHNTGTLTRPIPVAAGDTVVADFTGLGAVELTIATEGTPS